MTQMIARIEGYASIFNTPDLNGDVVSPGAFKRALREKGAEKIRMLYQHAPETPLGRWTKFREDSRGLYAEGELLLTSETARDVHALLRGRALDGLSIGFQTVRAAKHDRQARRFILEADLWEVSIVTFPMAPGARLSFVGEPESANPARNFVDTVRAAAEILSAPDSKFAAFRSLHPEEGRRPVAKGEGNGTLRMKRISDRTLVSSKCV